MGRGTTYTLLKVGTGAGTVGRPDGERRVAVTLGIDWFCDLLSVSGLFSMPLMPPTIVHTTFLHLHSCSFQ